MQNKFITLLLLSHTLLAYAAGDDVITPVQNDLPLLTQNDVNTQVDVDVNEKIAYAESLEKEQEQDSATAETKNAEESSFNKAYDYVINAIPKLDFVANKGQQEKSGNSLQPQDDLNTVDANLPQCPECVHRSC